MDLEPTILNKVNKVNSFKDRLNEACNKSSSIPEYGKGRQVTIAKMMGVSQEAVRKWLSGEARPRANSVKKLAKILDVEYIWLTLGSDQDAVSSYREASERQDAGLYAFVSYIVNAGGSVAFNKDSSDTSDLMVIQNGVMTKYSVTSANSYEGGGQQFVLKSQTLGVQTVCAVKHDSFDVAYEFVHVPFEIAAEHAKSGKDYIINNLQNLKYKEK